MTKIFTFVKTTADYYGMADYINTEMDGVSSQSYDNADIVTIDAQQLSLIHIWQSALLEQAVQQIQSCLDGNPDARLGCDREGELYRLFHSVNALTAVLSAHADNEQREKRFLKNTIADISHQLKTPLAALNIYNGCLLYTSRCV